MEPKEFIAHMKNVVKINIPGIGHRIKSLQNPDVRVKLLKEFVLKNFEKHPHLDFALEVEKLTTSKRNNLILNVDGCIGITFLDMLENLDFTPEEIEDVIFSETLNGLFVLGRSIGMMGHIFDQKRMRLRSIANLGMKSCFQIKISSYTLFFNTFFYYSDWIQTCVINPHKTYNF